jgi:hypothetical protein
VVVEDKGLRSQGLEWEYLEDPYIEKGPQRTFSSDRDTRSNGNSHPLSRWNSEKTILALNTEGAFKEENDPVKKDYRSALVDLHPGRHNMGNLRLQT